MTKSNTPLENVPFSNYCELYFMVFDLKNKGIIKTKNKKNRLNKLNRFFNKQTLLFH